MLHFRRAVCAAEIFERVDTLAVFAVVSGRRCDDLRLALDARADLSDLRQQCIRIFAGHAQLLGLKDKHAVLNAVQFADALLHLRRAVCTADILKRVNALDAVAPCGVLVMMVVMLVVVTAAAVVVIVVMVVMMLVLMVVTAAAVIVILVVVVMMFVLVVVTAAAVVIIVVMVMMMLVLVVVTAAAVIVIIVVVMMMFVLMLVVVTAAAVVVIVVVVMMMFVLVLVTAAAVIVVMVMMMMLVVVRFFYFLCVRSGFFLLLFCHCCRLLIRNNI